MRAPRNSEYLKIIKRLSFKQDSRQYSVIFTDAASPAQCMLQRHLFSWMEEKFSIHMYPEATLHITEEMEESFNFSLSCKFLNLPMPFKNWGFLVCFFFPLLTFIQLKYDKCIGRNSHCERCNMLFLLKISSSY